MESNVLLALFYKNHIVSVLQVRLGVLLFYRTGPVSAVAHCNSAHFVSCTGRRVLWMWGWRDLHQQTHHGSTRWFTPLTVIHPHSHPNNSTTMLLTHFIIYRSHTHKRTQVYNSVMPHVVWRWLAESVLARHIRHPLRRIILSNLLRCKFLPSHGDRAADFIGRSHQYLNIFIFPQSKYLFTQSLKIFNPLHQTSKIPTLKLLIKILFPQK